MIVFTLQSIKSRIETKKEKKEMAVKKWFLLYSPLNQGLKPKNEVALAISKECFYSTVH